MLLSRLTTLTMASLATGSLMFAAQPLVVPDLTVGRNLQTSATVTLDQPAPEGGVEITLTSDDPSQLRLSKHIAEPGAPSIVLSVKAKMRETPEYWVHGVGEGGGVATYTVTAPGLGTSTGKVTLTPSAILLMGPLRAPSFRTTPRATPSRLALYAVRLDDSGRYVEQQAVAGGMTLNVEISSSESSVGVVDPETLVIKGGTGGGTADFKPLGVGNTTLSISVPPGFTKPAEHSSLVATVTTPGLALSQDLVIGQNLQVRGIVGLGEAAPEGGVRICVTSSDPRRLLLSPSPTSVGSATITIDIPAGGVNAPVYLQALADSGTATYEASAPGCQTRKVSVTFAPAGVVIMLKPYGPPDEAELHGHTGSPTGLVFASLSSRKKLPLAVWVVQLDPVTLRSADVTVQPLRAGASLDVAVETSNPGVGRVLTPVKIAPGTEFAATEFTPASVGETVISVVTPPGFRKSANSTSVTAVVKP